MGAIIEESQFYPYLTGEQNLKQVLGLWQIPAGTQQIRERGVTFILVSSRQDCSARTALQAYKRQDQDEQGFRGIKDRVTWGRFS